MGYLYYELQVYLLKQSVQCLHNKNGKVPRNFVKLVTPISPDVSASARFTWSVDFLKPIYTAVNGTLNVSSNSMFNGCAGIGNNGPIAPLVVGNSSVVGSDGSLVIAKCSAVGTRRHYKIGIVSSYDFVC
jgi:hypothetical protein